jgi:hypothetical protein
MNDETPADDVRRPAAHAMVASEKLALALPPGVGLEVRHVARLMLGAAPPCPWGLAPD